MWSSPSSLAVSCCPLVAPAGAPFAFGAHVCVPLEVRRWRCRVIEVTQIIYLGPFATHRVTTVAPHERFGCSLLEAAFAYSDDDDDDRDRDRGSGGGSDDDGAGDDPAAAERPRRLRRHRHHRADADADADADEVMVHDEDGPYHQDDPPEQRESRSRRPRALELWDDDADDDGELHRRRRAHRHRSADDGAPPPRRVRSRSPPSAAAPRALHTPLPMLRQIAAQLCTALAFLKR